MIKSGDVFIYIGGGGDDDHHHRVIEKQRDIVIGRRTTYIRILLARERRRASDEHRWACVPCTGHEKLVDAVRINAPWTHWGEWVIGPGVANKACRVSNAFVIRYPGGPFIDAEEFDDCCWWCCWSHISLPTNGWPHSFTDSLVFDVVDDDDEVWCRLRWPPSFDMVRL